MTVKTFLLQIAIRGIHVAIRMHTYGVYIRMHTYGVHLKTLWRRPF